MNKQEAIEKIKNIETLNIKDRMDDKGVDMVIKNQVLTLIEQIDEPQKVMVPKFVAEWIEELKKSHSNLAWVWQVYPNETKIKNWLESNTEKFMRAWLDGYEIEQEKLYTVEIPNPNLNAHVVLQKTGEGIVLVTVGNARWRGWESSKLTESEIKKDFDFLWQFAKEEETDE